jgi:hypothetical protein
VCPVHPLEDIDSLVEYALSVEAGMCGDEDVAKLSLALDLEHQFLECFSRDAEMLPLDLVHLSVLQHKAQILLPK